MYRTTFLTLAIFCLLFVSIPGLFVIGKSPQMFLLGFGLFILFLYVGISSAKEATSSDYHRGKSCNVTVKEYGDKFAIYMNGEVYQNYVYGRNQSHSSAEIKLKSFIFKNKEKAQKIAELINDKKVYAKRSDGRFWVIDASGQANAYELNHQDRLEPVISNNGWFIRDSWDCWDDSNAIYKDVDKLGGRWT